MRSRNNALVCQPVAATCPAHDNRPMPEFPVPRHRLGGALAVGIGIFLSRVAGLVRSRAIGYYLGQGAVTDAFNAAMRIPNLLQNLLGEGVLSASLIPVYARLNAEGRHEEASRVARAVGTMLALVASIITLAGVLAAPTLVDLLVPGYAPSTRALTIVLVRILFPGAALLVMSAWCLGVLNSHRKFFLSYVSPVLWNAAIISTTVAAGRRLAGYDDDIAAWMAWGALIGSAAQFLVQLPTVIALLRRITPSFAVRQPGVQTTLRAFGPVLLGRGSVQLSAFIDGLLVSYLGAGFYTAMMNAQILYMLPISLFGMAVSAAELPEMSSALGDDAARAEHLQKRLRPALRQVVFLVVPSAAAFVAIGGPIVALLFQTGRFGSTDTHVVWMMLAGSALGLSAGTQGRLLGSAFYALGDPKPPLRAAVVRVAITGTLGYAFALPVRQWAGYSSEWGAFGLTASAGFAAWIEFLLLERWLSARIGKVEIPVRLGFGALIAAAVAGAAGYGAAVAMHAITARTIWSSLAAVFAFGVVYLSIMTIARVPEARGLARRVLSRR
jgi:putative peptidoglycan lipid II flippase